MLRVVPATGARLIPALDILYSTMSSEERATRVAMSAQAAADGELDLSRLLLAELNEEPVGALLLRMQPADVLFVWPPIVKVNISSLMNSCSNQRVLVFEAIEDALLQAAVRKLDESNAWIGQSLLELGQSRERAALSRNGFSHLTDLKFFECLITPESASNTQFTEGMKGRLSYIPYRRTRNRLRFSNVIERTYRGSQDCPEMNGVRSASQALQVYEASGPVMPDMWRLYCYGGKDVGVILLIDRAEQNAWEVVYLGVVDSARRQGIARNMLIGTIHAASAAQVERLLIVVDTRNFPAIQLYESLGFSLFDVRAAYVRLRITGE